LSVVGQAQFSRRAVKQADSEMVLELRDLPGDGGLA
jgi:hypothetical protein